MLNKTGGQRDELQTNYTTALAAGDCTGTGYLEFCIPADIHP
jgi:hypothetical protein